MTTSRQDGWTPIVQAPKNGTLLDLVIVEVHPTTGDLIVTTSIGFNAADNDGIDAWQYVTWNPGLNVFQGIKVQPVEGTPAFPVFFRLRPQDEISAFRQESARVAFQLLTGG